MRGQNKGKPKPIGERAQVRRQMVKGAAPGTGEGPAPRVALHGHNSTQVLLNMMEDAAVLISVDGILLRLNEVAAHKLGDTAESLIGRNFFELFPSDVAAERRIRLLEVVRSGMPIRSVDVEGGRLTETLVYPVSHANGKIEMLALFSRDITNQMQADLELRKAKEAAESADIAKSSFLAQMSHELRTPLNAIIGFSEILEDQTFGPLNERQLRYINHVHASGLHLLELINQILDLSKVEAGKMELFVSPVNISQLLENGVVMIMEKARRHGIKIDLNIGAELSGAGIQADETKLRQIVFNLLSNAAKFTPDGGCVELSAWKEGDELIISVSDTGIGLKPEDRERIFGAFEQLDSSYARRQQGTGLGLALARSLVELHGGRIWAESEGEGKGSKFTFAIPIIASQAHSVRHAAV
ncbi:MAG: ATP-binding protein [Desulfomonilaceae bacterium]